MASVLYQNQEQYTRVFQYFVQSSSVVPAGDHGRPLDVPLMTADQLQDTGSAHCFDFCAAHVEQLRVDRALGQLLRVWTFLGLHAPASFGARRPNPWHRRLTLACMVAICYIMAAQVATFVSVTRSDATNTASEIMTLISTFSFNVIVAVCMASVYFSGHEFHVWGLLRFVVRHLPRRYLLQLEFAVKVVFRFCVVTVILVEVLAILAAPFATPSSLYVKLYDYLGYGVNDTFGVFVIILVLTVITPWTMLVSMMYIPLLILSVYVHTLQIRAFSSTLMARYQSVGGLEEEEEEDEDAGRTSMERIDYSGSSDKTERAKNNDADAVTSACQHHYILGAMVAHGSKKLQWAFSGLLAMYGVLSVLYFFLIVTRVQSDSFTNNVVALLCISFFLVALLYLLAMPYRDFQELHRTASGLNGLSTDKRLQLLLYFRHNVTGWMLFGSHITPVIALRTLYVVGTVFIFILQQAALRG